LPKDRHQGAIASLPDFAMRDRELAVLAEATGRLWLNGVTPNWKAVETQTARRISLPTYPFEPERHWIDAPATASSHQPATAVAAIAAQASSDVITDHA